MEEKFTINTEIKNIKLQFKTSTELFSPKDIDKGTLSMLSVVDFSEDDKILDLGCGYGVVGILAAKSIGANNVVMVDKVNLAVDYSRENAKLNEVQDVKIYQSDGFENITDKDFTLILSNPPYHADFTVPKEFIEKGFNRLSVGGKLYMVTKRKDWYKNKFISIFGGVKIWEIEDYFVFMAVKKNAFYASSKPKKITRDGHIHSPYCPHGTKDSFELYIKKAISLGLKEMTFTEHMPLPGTFADPEFLASCSPTLEVAEKYVKELNHIKSKYKQNIKINTGFEVDYVEGYEDKIKELLNKFGNKIEDSILSVHFIKIEDEYYAVDVSPKEFGKIAENLGGVEKVYDKYYETLLKAIKSDLGKFKPKRIGHPTLVRIFNTEYPLEYNNYAIIEEIVKEIKSRNYEVDFNTAGFRKPYCKELYPSGTFAELVKKYDIKFVYGSDAHTASDVGRDFA